MLNIFRKNKRKRETDKSVRNGGGKRASKSTIKKTRELSSDQSMSLAADKLDSTIKRLAGKKSQLKTANNKQDLISKAIAIQKSQSSLLDNLDDETRRRLKTLALEVLILRNKK